MGSGPPFPGGAPAALSPVVDSLLRLAAAGAGPRSGSARRRRPPTATAGLVPTTPPGPPSRLRRLLRL
ncbi:hypothetical protein [Streptomyces monashensis]|uniref:hypothetical protein n=1 Tax=Streptomyces monashensis TaxID=1678012 RepID=UPI00116074FF|nr:hypothetical protein [Streptomyces monashensis]